MQKFTSKQIKWIGAIAGVAYGLIARCLFGMESMGDVLAVMSTSFIIGMPIALGFITIWYSGEVERKRWTFVVFAPWSSALICFACCLLFAWEGVICIVLWAPIALILSTVGGVMAIVVRWLFPPIPPADNSRHFCVAVVALLPFAAAGIESLRVNAAEVRTVRTAIEIKASPQVVWREIRSVPAIQPGEHSFSWSHLMGFPRPVEAVLEGEGIGAVRYARFEGKVLFVERITEWEEPKHLSFDIHADTKAIPPSTFDEHVTIGGPYFDVLRGTYRIEQLPSGVVMLHLSSDQRLSTGFNFYSHLWTEALMADLQDYILKIIKRRCEKGLSG